MLSRSSVLMLLLFTACGDDPGDPADAGAPSRDGEVDELDCTGVFDCVDGCRDADDACVDACIARGSRSALPAVDDLLECAESNDCEGEACLSLRCEPELLACAGVPARDGGVRDGGVCDGGAALDCPGVFECVDACGEGDDACADACVVRGASQARPVVDDVLACAGRYGCEDESCLAERCAQEILACAGAQALDGGPADAGVAPDARAGCESAGTPELTGPITGLAASYAPGDPIDIGVPVDQDTARVIVGVYEIGSMLYLGGTAEDVTASSTANLSLFAGVKNGKTGRFYLSVELCSTRVCTTPFVRNTYQRADRSAPRMFGESYVQTRENVGGPAASQTCPSSIPVQSFAIE